MGPPTGRVPPQAVKLAAALLQVCEGGEIPLGIEDAWQPEPAAVLLADADEHVRDRAQRYVQDRPLPE